MKLFHETWQILFASANEKQDLKKEKIQNSKLIWYLTVSHLINCNHDGGAVFQFVQGMLKWVYQNAS